MTSTDRQHQLVYSISSLKQVRFITTEQDLSLASHFTLSSLEPIKCASFSRESAPQIWNSIRIPYSIKLLKRSSFRKKIKELLLNFLRSEDDYVEVSHLIISTLGKWFLCLSPLPRLETCKLVGYIPTLVYWALE